MKAAASFLSLMLFLGFPSNSATHDLFEEARWSPRYNFTYRADPITFHYRHGVLAGSYNGDSETTEVRFDDVCAWLGHVCLCGAGGFRISSMAVRMLSEGETPPERGEFTLVSSRDHTVSDVIAFVLGCARREDPSKNRYFIGGGIESTKREYQYFIACHSSIKAVRVIYRKHLLIGNEKMDRLWKIELAYEVNPADVPPSDIKLYRDTMVDMVREALFSDKEGLFEVTTADYDSVMALTKRSEP